MIRLGQTTAGCEGAAGLVGFFCDNPVSSRRRSRRTRPEDRNHDETDPRQKRVEVGAVRVFFQF